METVILGLGSNAGNRKANLKKIIKFLKTEESIKILKVSPVYETEKQSASHLPDFRTVLYWSPDIYTDAAGKANVNFYTSDQPGKYIGVVQGISASGKAGMQTFSFEDKPVVTP